MKKMLGILCLLSLIAINMVFAAGNQDQTASKYPVGNLDLVAPAGAGGGWDLTIRTVGKVLADTKTVTVPMPVRNAPGAGGMTHLAMMQAKKGDDRMITVYSPPLLLLPLGGQSQYSYQDTTPLARLISDYAAWVVKGDSKYNTMMDVMNALKANPKSVKIGGTSAAGSMDHVAFLIMANAAGVKNLKDIDYIAFDSDGATQVMGGHIDVFSTSLGDVAGLIQSGSLKCIGQSADKRIGTGKVAEVKTCKEQGINQIFTNWRGLFGTPGMPEYAVKYWRDALGKLVKTTQWTEACNTNGWDNVYLDAPEFSKFLEQTNNEYTLVLKEIGFIK